jgi:hypothetical protein
VHHVQCKEEEDLNHEFQMLHTQKENIEKNMFLHTHTQICSIFFFPSFAPFILFHPASLSPSSQHQHHHEISSHTPPTIKREITTMLVASLKKFAQYKAIIVNIFHECKNKNSKSHDHQ